ncbi:hypothetical protein F2Q70_00024542 [Brassica cretica]|uniref:F-box domain-containing protein n=1 Tax=Brassica cretica TaxID=69181 RepID=A0A8S9L716_BRACR|nr:hypothetical protein F2Q70_00024542 [Brassica cretica]
MLEEKENPNPIYMVFDILEELFLRLPLKPILKFKTVSKQWRTILESEMFVARSMNVKQNRKILAAHNCSCGYKPSLLLESQFEGDEEIIYMHFDATRPMLSCNGLLCFPEPDCITVLNPSTGQNLRFPSGQEPVSSRFRNGSDMVMGFGRDRVTGSYKVVKVFVESMFGDCNVLDVESGLLHIGSGYHMLALDIHKEKFHRVSAPDTLVTRETKIVNLENRLAIAKITVYGVECILEICSMNAEEEIWSNTYAINLAGVPESKWSMFTPLAVSNQGNLALYNDRKSLFKYYPQTYELRCLSSDSCVHVVSPYLENLAPLRSKSAHHPGHLDADCFRKGSHSGS